MPNQPLYVFTDGTDTVIATELEDVPAVIAMVTGTTFEGEMRSLTDWRQIPPEQGISVRLEERVDIEKFAPGVQAESATVRKSARLWACEHGRGLLCSTEY